MCICINCQFYSSCWINAGLINFPLNYKNLINYISYKTKRMDIMSFIYSPVSLEIQLNINSKNYTREADIIYCDAFMEKPGSWLI